MGTWVGKEERVRQTRLDGFGMETQGGWGWRGPPQDRRESRSVEWEDEGAPKRTVWTELADPGVEKEQKGGGRS